MDLLQLPTEQIYWVADLLLYGHSSFQLRNCSVKCQLMHHLLRVALKKHHQLPRLLTLLCQESDLVQKEWQQSNLCLCTQSHGAKSHDVGWQRGCEPILTLILILPALDILVFFSFEYFALGRIHAICCLMNDY